MDARPNVSESAITKPTEQRSERNRRLKVGGGIALVVLLLAVTTHSRESESSAASVASPQAVRTEAPAAFEYFPAQFGTPVANGLPEEHIQAF